MIEVKVRDESHIAFENAMRTFKKLCIKDGFMMEIRDRRYYKKPSEKKREAKREAIKRQKRENQKDKDE